jgi:DMSO/TMAO reductase YedYZ molybdopterin-dependent catalytic subunit
MNTKGTPMGRRVILGMLGLGAAGAAFGSRIQSGLDSALSTLSSKDATGISGLLPGGGGFRFYNVADSIPHRSESDYRLTVSGLVGKRATYTLADLRDMPQTQLVRDVQCVTGWRVDHTPWEGVRLSHLLDLAEVPDEATAVRFTCFDGAYTESLTLAQARRDDILVALKMGGKPVTTEHGGPVRLYVAPMYFYKSAKWLSGIELTREVEPGYWEHYGYDVDAWVGKSNGRSDDPTS